jgi:hypothetical protein
MTPFSGPGRGQEKFVTAGKVFRYRDYDVCCSDDKVQSARLRSYITNCGWRH